MSNRITGIIAGVALGVASGLFWGLADRHFSAADALGLAVLVLAYQAFFYLDGRWGSNRFTVVLLALWGVASVLGTLFPQFPGQPRDVVATEVTRVFSERHGSLAGPLLVGAQFHDVFHSHWYRTILAMVGIEVLLCIWDRAGASLRQLRRPTVRVKPDALRSMDHCFGVTADIEHGEALRAVTESFQQRRYGIMAESEGDGTSVLCRRGAVALLGPLLTHVGVIAVFVGAVYGGSPLFGGFDTRVAPVEGGWAHEPHSDLYLKLERLEVPQNERGMELDYRSHVSFYEPTSGNPADAVIEIVRLQELEAQMGAPHPIEEIIELAPQPAERDPNLPSGERVKLRKVKDAVVQVNHPASVRKIGFYQSDWGFWSVELSVRGAGEEATREVRVWRTADGGLEHDPMPILVQFGSLPEVSVWPVSVHVVPGGPPDQDGNLQPWPHVALAARRESEDENLQSIGTAAIGEPVEFGRYEIEVTGLRKFSGLQASRDPGIALVLFGFGLLTLGLVLSFYVPLRVFRCRVARSGEKTSVIIAAPRRTGDGVAKQVAREVLHAVVKQARRGSP